MSIPKIGAGKPGQKSADGGTADKAAATPSSGFTGSSGFDSAPQPKLSTQKLSIDIGGMLNNAIPMMGQGAGRAAGGMLGEQIFGTGSAINGLFDAAKGAVGLGGSPAASGSSANDSWGPLGKLFDSDPAFSREIGQGFNNFTNSLGASAFKAIKEGIAEGSGTSSKSGKGIDGMSKEVEKKFWDIYFMRSILNGSKKAQEEQEKAMKKALKDMGVNVPDDAGHADVPTTWDFWACHAAIKAGVKEDFAKWKFIGGPTPERYKKKSSAKSVEV
jgi:hypothetical protein